MTNKEAINHISRNKSVFQYDTEMTETLNLAIKALENERPQTIGCFNCKHNYKTVKAEACKYCNEKYSEWEVKDGAEGY